MPSEGEVPSDSAWGKLYGNFEAAPECVLRCQEAEDVGVQGSCWGECVYAKRYGEQHA